MKFLKDRTEIAKAINIEKLPVVRINIAECKRGYDDCYEGDKIKVRVKDMDIRCRVAMYGDGENKDLHETPWLYKKIEFMPETIGLTAGFGYTDVMEMAEWNRTPLVNAGDEIIVIFDGKDKCFIRKMRVGKATAFVYPTAILEDVE